MKLVAFLHRHILLLVLLINSWIICRAETSCIQTTDNGPPGNVRGNSGGANCVFPFIFEGNEYTDCTSFDGGTYYNAWCATTDNFDVDFNWGYCIIPTYGGDANGANCKFPFNHNGNEHKVCIRTADRQLPWCEVGDGNRWGYCDMTCSRAAIPTTTTTTTPVPTATSSSRTTSTLSLVTTTTESDGSGSSISSSSTPTPPAAVTSPGGVLFGSTKASTADKAPVNIGLVVGISVCVVVILMSIGVGVTLFIIHRKKKITGNKNPTAESEPPVYYNIVNETTPNAHTPPPKQRDTQTLAYTPSLGADTPSSQVDTPTPRANTQQAQTQNLATYENVQMHDNVATNSDYYNMMQGVHNDSGMGTDGDNSVYETPSTNTYVNEVGSDSGASNVYQQLQNNN